MNDKGLQMAAEAAIAENPDKRNIHFTYQENRYWIKRLMSNHRNQFAKYSPENQFLAEVARSSIAQCTTGLSPEIVILTPTYMVTRSGGHNLNWWMKSDAEKEEKIHILCLAGQALGRLHQSGMTHGRPALRDFLYDNGKITLLDWENKSSSSHLDRRKAIDLLLFLHSMYRENYCTPEFIEAMESGYHSQAGEQTFEDARKFLLHHKAAGTLARHLNWFHMKDIDAFSRLYDHVTKDWTKPMIAN
jgi:hypothetical protein